MAISDQLKQAMEDSGETLYRIAKDSDVPYPVVHRFYNGERDIRLETADKLAEYCGLELSPKKKSAPKRKGTK